MLIFSLIVIAVGLLFIMGVPFGAPYLPTLKQRVTDGLDLLNLKKGQTMLELGCGDGRLLVEAAKRGIYGIGYELNPVLVVYGKLKSWRYRRYVTIHWGNYWNKEWPPSDGMYVFLLQPFMSRLNDEVQKYADGKPYRVVSFAYVINEKKHAKELNGMRLYIYNTKR